MLHNAFGSSIHIGKNRIGSFPQYLIDSLSVQTFQKNISKTRSSSYFESCLLLDKSPLLGHQSNTADEEDGLLGTLHQLAPHLLDQHHGDEGLAAAGAEVDDGVALQGLVQQLHLVGTFFQPFYLLFISHLFIRLSGCTMFHFYVNLAHARFFYFFPLRPYVLKILNPHCSSWSYWVRTSRFDQERFVNITTVVLNLW